MARDGIGIGNERHETGIDAPRRPYFCPRFRETSATRCGDRHSHLRSIEAQIRKDGSAAARHGSGPGCFRLGSNAYPAQFGHTVDDVDHCLRIDVHGARVIVRVVRYCSVYHLLQMHHRVGHPAGKMRSALRDKHVTHVLDTVHEALKRRKRPPCESNLLCFTDQAEQLLVFVPVGRPRTHGPFRHMMVLSRRWSAAQIHGAGVVHTETRRA